MADSRNWLTVLDVACAECGIWVGELQPEELAPKLYASIDAWDEILRTNDPAELTRREQPETWSPVEYGSHVADVMDLFQERIFLMVSEDSPTFPSFDPDAAAATYVGRTPEEVADRIEGAGNRLGQVFESLDPALWARTGQRGDGAAFTVLSIGRYLLHDDLHHLFDVRRFLGEGSQSANQAQQSQAQQSQGPE